MPQKSKFGHTVMAPPPPKLTFQPFVEESDQPPTMWVTIKTFIFFIHSFLILIIIFTGREQTKRQQAGALKVQQKCLSTKICGCIRTFNWKAQINEFLKKSSVISVIKSLACSVWVQFSGGWLHLQTWIDYHIYLQLREKSISGILHIFSSISQKKVQFLFYVIALSAKYHIHITCWLVSS